MSSPISAVSSRCDAASARTLADELGQRNLGKRVLDDLVQPDDHRPDAAVALMHARIEHTGVALAMLAQNFLIEHLDDLQRAFGRFSIRRPQFPWPQVHQAFLPVGFPGALTDTPFKLDIDIFAVPPRLFDGDEHDLARRRDRAMPVRHPQKRRAAVEERIARAVVEGSKTGLEDDLAQALADVRPGSVVLAHDGGMS